jgi:hypothetical protein
MFALYVTKNLNPMEEKTRSSTQNALYYGLITGAALVVFNLILYITDQYMNKYLGYFAYFILVAVMFWGTFEYRKTYMNGFMSYGKAFSSCFMIGLFSAIIVAVYSFIFAQFIYPGFTEEILEKARESMMNSNQQMSQEQLDTALEWTRKFTSPVMMALWSFVAYLFFSAILALLASIFLKKEDKSLTSNT